NVSSSSALVPHESKETAASSPAVANPLRNPSYPQRSHFGERPQLEETLSSWEQKINNLAGILTALGNHPGRATYERLFFQMQGARDQMAKPCAGCLWRPAPSTRKTANGSRPQPPRLGDCFRAGMASKLEASLRIDHAGDRVLCDCPRASLAIRFRLRRSSLPVPR